MLERIDRFVQMPARQVQVNARCLEVGVPKQDLYGGQIGPVLQQVRGEAVPEDIVAVPMIFTWRRSGIAITLCTA